MNKIVEYQLKQSDKKSDCKGIYWRAHVSQYLSSHNSIEVKKSLRLLKRKSCVGCQQCAWIWEYLKEDINNDNFDDYLDGIIDQKIYTYSVNSYQAYDDLYPEIEIELIEAPEPQ